MSDRLDAVVQDLAPHPYVQWAVVFRGHLLPVRFSREGEAHRHLLEMQHGKPVTEIDPAAVAAAGARILTTERVAP